MTGGNGTTSFEIVNQDNGGTLWRDIIVASGETQQVKRVMSPQPFFQPGRTESSVVVTWLTLGILVMVVLNFPILETVLALVRRKTRRRPRGSDGNNGEGDDEAEEATEQK